MRFPRTVYAIQHVPTGRIYVGSTSCLDQRIKSHIAALKNGKHPNKDMQRDCEEFGFDYEFFVIDSITGMDDRSKEKEWMDKLNTGNPKVGYNSRDPHFKHSLYEMPEITPGVPIPNEIDEEEESRDGKDDIISQ